MTTRILAENAALREQVRVLNKLVVSQAERIAAQSELLARSASRPACSPKKCRECLGSQEELVAGVGWVVCSHCASRPVDGGRQWECCPACQGTGSADNRPADEGMFCIACNGSGGR